MKRSAFKRRRPPTTAIRKSAKGEACTLRFPCCNGDRSTTVWCHSNRSEDGTGMGLKARDEEGCYGVRAATPSSTAAMPLPAGRAPTRNKYSTWRAPPVNNCCARKACSRHGRQ